MMKNLATILGELGPLQGELRARYPIGQIAELEADTDR